MSEIKQQRQSAVERRRKTLIVGLGATGLSCARYLSSRGVPLAVTDSRDHPPGLDRLLEDLPDTALFLGGFSAAAFAAAERLIVSPGVALAEPMIQAAIAAGVPVLGDVELFCQVAAAPYVAITGSNGKSTVTTLLGEMAAAQGINVAVGGNIGRPVLDLLDAQAELYVLELSSFQLETTESLQPVAATVLNLSPDHLDRYPGLAGYAQAKGKVYRAAQARVFNRDDAAVMAMCGQGGKEKFFGVGEPEEGQYGLRRGAGEFYLARGEALLLPVSQLLIPGRHNQSNALAALALGEALELSLEGMLETLRRFRGLPHRTQFVRELRGVRWYNDSKGTNTGATIAALDGLAESAARNTLLLAGGEGKGADFSELAPAVARNVRCAILFGRDAGLIEQALAPHTRVLRAADLAQAVALADAEAESGERVLLSPACASFDMFRNYAHRGEMFMDLVMGLRE
ncbi:MAG: UDP-N-acetylmuramoyl-L-alanine--D-glutamate ligase [Gammaproteobacteria bacterium]|nr:UDP-N-acetylmuramoyl-L-alanine--D-glutamate ligase [Gammaproteobacteria bacterium]